MQIVIEFETLFTIIGSKVNIQFTASFAAIAAPLAELNCKSNKLDFVQWCNGHFGDLLKTPQIILECSQMV